MYFQPDPVLRMIEMLGDFIRRLFSLPAGDLAAEGERLLDEAARKMGGMPLAMARSLEPESIINAVRDNDRAWALAEILEASGEVLRMADDEQGAARDMAAAMELWLRLGVKSSMAGVRDRVYAKVRALQQRGIYPPDDLWEEFLILWDP